MHYKQKFGQIGEDIAAEFLTKNGFNIIERNVRCGHIGEIDIVASQGSLIIFAEVKTRSNLSLGGALYSISKKKRTTMRRSAEWYIVSRNISSNAVTFRFDLIAIDNKDVTWVQDILR